MRFRKHLWFVFCVVFGWMLLQCFCSAAAYGDSVPVTIQGKCDYAMAYEVLDLTNQLREAKGRAALVMDGDLMEAAMQRAAECRLIFDHSRPDVAPGEINYNCWEVLPSKVNGENITISSGWTTAQEPVEAWRKSVHHYQNLLTDDYLSTGIGCFRSNGVVSWVQLFGFGEADKAPSAISSNNISRTFRINVHYKYLDNFTNIVLDKTYNPLTAAHTVNRGETKTLKLQFFYPMTDGSDPTEAVYTYPYNYTEPDVSKSLIPQLEWSDFTLESSDPGVLSVDGNGNVTAKKAGTVTITAKHRQVADARLTYQITVLDKESRTVIFYANGGSMKEKGAQSRATHTYLYNKKFGSLPNAYRKGYIFKGWYTSKTGGSKITKNSVVRIKRGTTEKLYAHWSKIRTDTPNIKKVSSPSKARLKVQWKKVSGVSGYQVEIAATDKFGKKTEQSILIKGASKTSYTFKGLKKCGAKYYVRVRAYRTDSTGKKIYSKYSKIFSVKVKK